MTSLIDQFISETPQTTIPAEPQNELIESIARDYGLAKVNRFGQFEVGGPLKGRAGQLDTLFDFLPGPAEAREFQSAKKEAGDPIVKGATELGVVQDDPVSKGASLGISLLGLMPFAGGAVRSTKTAAKNVKDLAVIHNLTAKNLQKADEFGGLPVPSLAVVDKDKPITSFGEITLVGDEALATPSRGNPFFRADAYSPRFPEMDFKYENTDEFIRVVGDDIEALGDSKHIFFDNLDSRDPLQSIRENAGVMRKFLRMKGKDVEPVTAPRGNGETFVRRFDTQEKYKKQIDDIKGGRKAFNEWTEQQFKKLNPEARIFKGFTPSGRRRYVPATKENILKEMMGKINDAEGFNYGIGSYRAAITPKIKNLKEMRDIKGALVTKEEMESVKEKMTDQLFQIHEELEGHAIHKSDGFGGIDITMERLKDITSGRDRFENYYHTVPDELKEKITKFNKELIEAPTEYFEGKPQRLVGIDEFKGAILPEEAPQEVVDILKNAGIEDLKFYKDEADRVGKLKEFKKLLFTTVPAAATVLFGSSQIEKNELL